MKDYSIIAVENFKKGYNCAQAVFMTFSSELGLDENTSLKLSSSFGGGMGRLREVCGAVTAMFAIAGLKCGYTSCNDDEIKAKHYELIQNLANEFKSEHNSIICRELLGLNIEADSPVPSARTKEYYDNRPCEFYIKKAAELIQTNFFS